MKWQMVGAGILVLISLLVILAISLNRSSEVGNGEVIKGSDTALLMLDPYGDRDLAEKILEQASAIGNPQVILSRRVLGGEMPCRGFDWAVGLASRPADEFGVVVLGGELRQNFPGGSMSPQPYMAYVYDLRYKGITAQGGPEWAPLRAAFGGPEWPSDSPMYLSTDGLPSLAETKQGYDSPEVPVAKWQDMHVSQQIGEWTVSYHTA